MVTQTAATRASALRRTGVAMVASVLLASGVVAASATFSARDAAAQPATPYASTVWGRLTLDPGVYGGGAVSGTLNELEVSVDGNQQWDINTGPGSAISDHLTSATGTASVNVRSEPETGMANTNGAFTNLDVPPPTTGGVASLVNQGPLQPSGNHRLFSVSTWNNRVQCAPPAGIIIQDSTTAPMFLGRLVDAPAPNASGTAVTELDFPGSYGDGITNAHVTVTITHVYEIEDPYIGHARTDYTAVVQGQDADGNPVGDQVTLFDMTLGDVRADCNAIAPQTPTEEPTPTPTPTPTESPSPTPSPTEEPSPSPSPTEEPSPSPTPSPTGPPIPRPTPSPTPSPTESPSPSPSPTDFPGPFPTPSPTEEPSPSPSPTGEPTPGPTEEPSPTASPTPTPGPTEEPSPSPSPGPSPSPSPMETPSPTPTPGPTGSPSPSPSETPSPSESPTDPGYPGYPDPEPPSYERPTLPVTGASLAALPLGGLAAIGAGITALVASRKRSV